MIKINHVLEEIKVLYAPLTANHCYALYYIKTSFIYYPSSGEYPVKTVY